MPAGADPDRGARQLRPAARRRRGRSRARCGGRRRPRRPPRPRPRRWPGVNRCRPACLPSRRPADVDDVAGAARPSHALDERPVIAAADEAHLLALGGARAARAPPPAPPHARLDLRLAARAGTSTARGSRTAPTRACRTDPSPGRRRARRAPIPPGARSGRSGRLRSAPPRSGPPRPRSPRSETRRCSACTGWASGPGVSAATKSSTTVCRNSSRRSIAEVGHAERVAGLARGPHGLGRAARALPVGRLGIDPQPQGHADRLIPASTAFGQRDGRVDAAAHGHDDAARRRPRAEHRRPPRRAPRAGRRRRAPCTPGRRPAARCARRAHASRRGRRRAGRGPRPAGRRAPRRRSRAGRRRSGGGRRRCGRRRRRIPIRTASPHAGFPAAPWKRAGAGVAGPGVRERKVDAGRGVHRPEGYVRKACRCRR